MNKGLYYIFVECKIIIHLFNTYLIKHVGEGGVVLPCFCIKCSNGGNNKVVLII